MRQESGQKDSLWWLVASPSLWMAHFLACWGTAALFCEKLAGRQAQLQPVRWAIGIYTVFALAGVALVAAHAYRRHRFGTATVPHDFDTQADRHRFLGFATFLLSLMSAVGIVYVALPAVFIGSCR